LVVPAIEPASNSAQQNKGRQGNDFRHVPARSSNGVVVESVVDGYVARIAAIIRLSVAASNGGTTCADYADRRIED
jgi:hypothetical protein